MPKTQNKRLLLNGKRRNLQNMKNREVFTNSKINRAQEMRPGRQ